MRAVAFRRWLVNQGLQSLEETAAELRFQQPPEIVERCLLFRVETVVCGGHRCSFFFGEATQDASNRFLISPPTFTCFIYSLSQELRLLPHRKRGINAKQGLKKHGIPWSERGLKRQTRDRRPFRSRRQLRVTSSIEEDQHKLLRSKETSARLLGIKRQ